MNNEEARLYPDFKWKAKIEGNSIVSYDWHGHRRIIPLDGINRIYIRTTDEGPFRCDLWFGFETHNQALELPSGFNGKLEILDYYMTWGEEKTP